jgi:hypothetical protein
LTKNTETANIYRYLISASMCKLRGTQTLASCSIGRGTADMLLEGENYQGEKEGENL